MVIGWRSADAWEMISGSDFSTTGDGERMSEPHTWSAAITSSSDVGVGEGAWEALACNSVTTSSSDVGVGERALGVPSAK